MIHTDVYGLDVEMVSVEPNFTRSAARVSLVAKNLQCVYDKFVRQQSRVLCYNTEISGITKDMLLDGKLLKNVRKDVLSILRDSIVVGHSIDHDFKVLYISSDDLDRINCIVRDTTEFNLFREVRRDGTTPSLKQLVKRFLNRNIQKGPHNSVVDARAVVQLYNKYEDEWEAEIDEEYSNGSDESYDSDSSDYDIYY